MADLFKQFMNHEILIDIQNAETRELAELEELTGLKWANGSPLTRRFVDKDSPCFIHARKEYRGYVATYSRAPMAYVDDVWTRWTEMKTVHIGSFLYLYGKKQIKDQEIDDIFLAEKESVP